MKHGRDVLFDAEDGSVVRAYDFGPEFGIRRYVTLNDLEPIIPSNVE